MIATTLAVTRAASSISSKEACNLILVPPNVLGHWIREIESSSHLTPHTSHLTPHTSHLTPHLSLQVALEFRILKSVASTKDPTSQSQLCMESAAHSLTFPLTHSTLFCLPIKLSTRALATRGSRIGHLPSHSNIIVSSVMKHMVCAPNAAAQSPMQFLTPSGLSPAPRLFSKLRILIHFWVCMCVCVCVCVCV